mmetsp:Transcript_81242/g.143287  ORF Transcript_81242/g.143287 Transcript_81242/m.143287 type:complete len:188 (+) Transcript_81242:82-645(+)|eukprot:CAMPEP_0197622960 /NCGR_PEP_ID=MMETSP1338-20131121/3064_1 /TAXON_ID=43686 ORGANISM="Pelagodinium beii, Strain RCC1491" /NCGR_SAMPLE_ID=MMETSP1338 /ASSEMBLY_ACC=CAM_ASM_000754 /LENGTH=187 /DNA_ID=CAMNT_0043192769 /DNA_START=57 /DNA_END=620 /DNA_ORIENTATION=-
MVSTKAKVIDCRGHLLGRLASVIAKELLNGQPIVAVRCEEINQSGSLYRNKVKYAEFRRKRMNTNPKKGPIHFRAPSRILWRTVRGMMEHKTARGKAAMARLKVFEGIPPPYDKVKRVVVPDALKVTRLRAERKYCNLGRLANDVGWKHWDLVKRLEEKRKAKSHAFYLVKKATAAAKAKAAAEVDA